MKNKVMILLVFVLLTAGALAACGNAAEEAAPELTDCTIQHEEEFGGVYIHNTIEEFNDLGFEYGDSLTITFSNGYQLEDIPYYNGFYTDFGDPLLVAYPGYAYVRAGFNNGDDLWEVAALEEDDLASVTLFERGKYAAIQNARDIHYEDDREKYDSDEIFANFRTVKGGDIVEGRLYRSAAPCDNQHNRAPYVDDLMEAAGVQCVINLNETPENLQKDFEDHAFDSPYFRSLYEQGKVCPNRLNTNYTSEEFKTKTADALRGINAFEGPWLIHCLEGKDRTGFLCMLVEALCGATYPEIVEDYMITYDNYYGITEETDKARYDIIVDSVLDNMLRDMAGKDVDIHNADLSGYAADYLKSGGMTEEEIAGLKARLTEPEN